MMKIKWLTWTLPLAFAAAALFAGPISVSFSQTGGQEAYGTRKSACGCFCGGSSPRYVVFEDQNCAGILAADACGNSLGEIPREKMEGYCKKLKEKDKITSFKKSCPVFAPFCEPEEAPPSTQAPGPGKEPSAADCRRVADTAADQVKNNGGSEKEQQVAYERAKYNCMEKK